MAFKRGTSRLLEDGSYELKGAIATTGTHRWTSSEFRAGLKYGPRQSYSEGHRVFEKKLREMAMSDEVDLNDCDFIASAEGMRGWLAYPVPP